MNKYFIKVTERHEDPEDWCCNSVSYREYYYDNNKIFDEETAEEKIEWLRKNKSYISLGGFDYIELTYKLEKYIT